MPHSVSTCFHTHYTERRYTMPRVDLMDLFMMDRDEWREWHRDEIGMYDEILDEARANGCVAVWPVGSRLWYLVHPSLYREAWQVTTWDEHGPMSHCYARDGHDLESAINDDDVIVYLRG